MSISRAEVEKVALLARLEPSDAQLEQLTSQMSAILAYVEQLAELDTEDVEPLAHTIELTNVFREDAVRPSTKREEMLSGAPSSDGECYLVPAVLGE
jgi:aspartyl-tRNA(Asn)/glutamyl-tRNA(Gln) amidotransferase subunit C